MKTLLSILIYSLLFGLPNSKDSLAIQKYDPKLGLNMTGLINQPKSQLKIQLVDLKLNDASRR